MKKVIVAPYLMHKDLLFKLRKDNPFLNIKMITKEELFREVFGEFSIESRLWLMNNLNITYDLATEIVSYLPYIYESNKRLDDLLQNKNELIKNGFYIRNNLVDVAYKDAEFEIYGYSKLDRVLLEALKRIAVPYKFIENDFKIPFMDVYKFNKVEDEVFYVLNKISSLIESGVSTEDIYLFNVDETYGYYIYLYQDSFNLKFNGLPQKPMYLSGFSSEFFKIYDQERDIQKAFDILNEVVKEGDEEDKKLDEFVETIKMHIYEDITFETQREILISELKKKSFKVPYYKNGIKIISSPIHVENKHIFIMNFALNIVPRTYKDDDYIFNRDKVNTFLYLSQEKNMIEKDLTVRFLNSNNNFYYSYSKYSLSNVYYPSSLILDVDKQFIDGELDEVLYSSKMLNYSLVERQDLLSKYKEKSDDYDGLKEIGDISTYKTYDNQFGGVNIDNKNVKNEISYSSIDDYQTCPFMFYLSRVLRFEEWKDNFDMQVGKLIHKTFEGIDSPDYSFEESYKNALKIFNFDKKQTLFLDGIKLQLLKTSEIIKEYFNQKAGRTSEYEKKFVMDFDENTILNGQPDRIVKLDKNNYIIIDYKSSPHFFDDTYIHEGLGLQLPIYYLLSSSDSEYSSINLRGLYYQQAINKKVDPFIEMDDYPEYAKLNGVTIMDNLNPVTLDASLDEPKAKSKFILGISLTKEGAINYNKGKGMLKEEMDEVMETVKRIISETSKRIIDNDFKINPFYVNDFNRACIYCDYRDICFVDAYHQSRKLSKDKGEGEEKEEAAQS